ncbi:MAG TPA: hypothetical protein VD793_09330 [Gemmatimonadales bacterium]|nr:hypothetical protein [Gemmatimonadales bacterium]
MQSVYPFRGGPWDGFVIEYGERARPDGVVDPRDPGPAVSGVYHLHRGEKVYVWAGAGAASPP